MNSLYNGYDVLKKDFKDVEAMKRNVDMILGKDGSLDLEKVRKCDDPKFPKN